MLVVLVPSAARLASPRRSLRAAAAATTPPRPQPTPPPTLQLMSSRTPPCPPSVQQDGRTATPSPTPAMASSSLARHRPANAQAALLMARELLRYRPANEGYDAWLGRITELVNAAGEAPAPSHSLRPPPSRAGDVAHGTPLPPPLCGDSAEPRHDARPRNPPRGAPVSARDKASC
jgi:hypothetical protein